MEINHETIRTACYIFGAIGGGFTGVVFVIKVAMFFGKVLSRMDSIDESIKHMAGHGDEIIKVKGRVHGLEQWREEVIEDARAGSGIFSKKAK